MNISWMFGSLASQGRFLCPEVRQDCTAIDRDCCLLLALQLMLHLDLGLVLALSLILFGIKKKPQTHRIFKILCLTSLLEKYQQTRIFLR